MDKYITYSFRNLLAYIDSSCKRMGEERDFPGHLLSMEQADTIDKLVQIYNNIYKLLAVIILDSYDLPKNWYKTNCLGLGNAFLFEELNQFFNQNILRLFKTYFKPTKQQIISCLANLREAKNINDIQEELFKRWGYQDTNELCYVIANRKKQYEQRKLIETKEDYLSVDESFSMYKHYSKFLAAHNRVFDIAEIAFGEEHNFSYDGLAEQYIKEKEISEECEKTNVIDNHNKDNGYRKILSIFIVSYFAVSALFLGLYFFIKPPKGVEPNPIAKSFINSISFYLSSWYILPLTAAIGIFFIICFYYYNKKLDLQESVSDNQDKFRQSLFVLGIAILFIPYFIILFNYIFLVIFMIIVLLALIRFLK